jgi:hypothetical protein
MFYIKGIGGFLCSTDALKMNQKKSAPAFMNATALEYSTREEAEKALATALTNFGNNYNKFEVIEE